MKKCQYCNLLLSDNKWEKHVSTFKHKKNEFLHKLKIAKIPEDILIFFASSTRKRINKKVTEEEYKKIKNILLNLMDISPFHYYIEKDIKTIKIYKVKNTEKSTILNNLLETICFFSKEQQEEFTNKIKQNL